MKHKITKTFLFFLLIISLASMVMAVPKVQTGDFPDGFDIKYPLYEAISLNHTTEFHFHVFNSSNGMPISEGIVCYFHLYNQTNNHIATLKKSTVENNYDYSFTVEGLNFTTVGEYNFMLQCNSSTLGGFDSVNLMVTQNGKEFSETKGLVLLAIMLGSILALLGCAFLFAYFYANTDELNRLLKLLYLGASLLCGVVTISIVERLVKNNQTTIDATLASTLGGTYSLVLWVFRIVMIMLVIYLLYSSSMALLGKREDTYLKDGKG